MLQRKPKKHQRYLLYRLYVAIVCIGALIWEIFWIGSFAAGKPPSALQWIGFSMLFPCFTIAVFMLMSAFFFPFEFSILGPFERTAFPNGQPIFKRTGSWGQIGLFRASVPFFSWYVYTSGLGISILGVGKVFIPTECIKAVKEDGGSFFSGSRYQLIHISPEVRSPIYLPDKTVYEKLLSVIKKESFESKIEYKAQSKSLDFKSRKLNFFLVIAVIWGIPVMWFSLSTIYARLSIDIEGEVISRQVIIDSYNVNRGTDYKIRLFDGTIIDYLAGANDPSLSRNIPVNAQLIKKKWSFNYFVNGKEVDDFPRLFYLLIGSIGFAIFAGDLFIGVRRMRK